MAKQNTKTTGQELDSVFFLKVLLFFILGSVWLLFEAGGPKVVPVGLIVGVLFAHHDHFAIDRKIEFAVLLGAAIVSYVAPLGLVLVL